MITRFQERHEFPISQESEDKGSSINCDTGLCVNCKHSPVCMHRKVAHQPVLHCEEYELSRTKRSALPKGPDCLTTASSSTSKATRLKGLCMNCEHRDTCTFPKPEGGVWRCEEYR